MLIRTPHLLQRISLSSDNFKISMFNNYRHKQCLCDFLQSQFKSQLTVGHARLNVPCKIDFQPPDILSIFISSALNIFIKKICFRNRKSKHTWHKAVYNISGNRKKCTDSCDRFSVPAHSGVGG